jgi:hypothetical protein
MKLTYRHRGDFAIELTIESGNTTLTEEVYADFGEETDSFIRIARELTLLNGKSDVDFAKTICDSFLNDSERERLIEMLINQVNPK